MIFDKLKNWWQRRKMFPHWHFYTFGKEALDAMYEACQKAEESIDFEQFIFANDDTGKKFAELLVRKALAGIKVRLLLDYAGSFDFSVSEWPNLIKDAGGEVRFFNVIGPWRIVHHVTQFYFYFRTHRKILVIDGKIGYIGGLGIRNDMLTWRDTHLSITGGIVLELKDTFDQIWKRTGQKTFFRFKRPKEVTRGFKVMTNSPRYKQRYIYYSTTYALQNASKYIYLTTPYFVPDRNFFRTLRLAAIRGVEVKLLLPEKSDNRLVDRGARSYFRAALKSGIQIFLYKEPFMHAKTIVIDDTWATIGSFNLDNLSFLWNYEANIESNNEKFAGELKAHFIEDLKNSTEVTLEKWEKRAFLRKVLEYLTLPLHRFM